MGQIETRGRFMFLDLRLLLLQSIEMDLSIAQQKYSSNYTCELNQINNLSLSCRPWKNQNLNFHS